MSFTLILRRRAKYRNNCLEYIYRKKGLTDKVLPLPKPYDDYSVDIIEGKVFSHKTGKWLKGGMHNNGYTTFNLFNAGKLKKLLLHRLIAYAITGRILSKDEIILHLDEGFGCGNVNNHYTNLKIGTTRENNNAPKRRRRLLMSGSKTISKPVVQCKKYTTKLIRQWDTIREAEICLGIDIRSISACCNGKLNSAGGFSWFFADKYEKLKKQPILQCDLKGKVIKRFKNVQEVQLKTGTKMLPVKNCCKHRTESYNGYKWFYESEYVLNNTHL